MTETILKVEDVSKHYGGVAAVDHVSFDIESGQTVGLIGPNGAGKTTLVNLISGAQKVSGGRIVFEGRDVTAMPPYRIARNGIARTFQVVQPFPRMTVVENVATGALFAGGARHRKDAHELAMAHLEFVGLDELANSPASTLTLAKRKRLELAKSLAMEPRLLLLDEVNAGLNSSEIEAALDLIRAIAERGVTIIIIEHVMKVVLSVCSRVLVLHHGALISEGTREEITSDPKVIEAYLGTKYAQRHRELAAHG
jgi:branched-chain amino acid transport system ATP-binding protein